MFFALDKSYRLRFGGCVMNISLEEEINKKAPSFIMKPGAFFKLRSVTPLFHYC